MNESQLTVQMIQKQRNDALDLIAVLSAKLELAEQEIARLKEEKEG